MLLGRCSATPSGGGAGRGLPMAANWLVTVPSAAAEPAGPSFARRLRPLRRHLALLLRVPLHQGDQGGAAGTDVVLSPWPEATAPALRRRSCGWYCCTMSAPTGHLAVRVSPPAWPAPGTPDARGARKARVRTRSGRWEAAGMREVGGDGHNRWRRPEGGGGGQGQAAGDAAGGAGPGGERSPPPRGPPASPPSVSPAGPPTAPRPPLDAPPALAGVGRPQRPAGPGARAAPLRAGRHRAQASCGAGRCGCASRPP